MPRSSLEREPVVMRWFCWQTASSPITLNAALQQGVSHAQTDLLSPLRSPELLLFNIWEKQWQNETSLVLLKLWNWLKTVVWQSRCTRTSLIFLEISWERDWCPNIPECSASNTDLFGLSFVFLLLTKTRVQKIFHLPLLRTHYLYKQNKSENTAVNSRVSPQWPEASRQEENSAPSKGGRSVPIWLVVTTLE